MLPNFFSPTSLLSSSLSSSAVNFTCRGVEKTTKSGAREGDQALIYLFSKVIACSSAHG